VCREICLFLALTWVQIGVADTRPTGSSSAGWAKADCETATWLAGAEVYGDSLSGGIAGLGSLVRPSRLSYIPHFRSTERWYTGIAALNPDAETECHATFTAWADDGTLMAEAERTIQPGTTICEVSESLLSVQGQGWIRVESDTPIVIMEVFGNKKDGGIAGVRACEAAQEFVIPHVQLGPYTGSGVALANPGDKPLTASVRLYDATGSELAEWTGEIEPKARLVRTFKSLFPGHTQTDGWARATASGPVVSVSTLSTWFPSQQGELAAIAPVSPRERMRLPAMISDESWTTTLILVNPSLAFGTIQLDAYDEEGGRLGSRQLILGPNEKHTGLATSLLDLPSSCRGWVDICADVPAVTMALLRLAPNEAGWGLAGITPADAGPVVYFPQVATTQRWWTQLWLAHPLAGSIAVGEVNYRDSDGLLLDACRITVPCHGGSLLRAEELLP